VIVLKSLRWSVRLAVIDQDGHVLLRRVTKPGAGTLWKLPGARRGADSRQTCQAVLAAIGMAGAEPGPVAWRRSVWIGGHGELVRHDEEFFVVRDRIASPVPDGHWVALSDVDSLTGDVHPRGLAAILAEYLTIGHVSTVRI
jgi:hypothetical protein